MTKSKLKKCREIDLIPFVIQARFEEVFRTDYKLKGKWAPLFFKNQNPVVLEIGCGRGEYTVGLARIFPDRNFIGVDIKGSRIHQGATQAVRENLRNVAFIRTRVELLSSFFAEGEIDEIWLTFPDPQLNKTRKRLLSARFLTSYAGFLKPGGVIHIKTDSRFLYMYAKALVETNKLRILNDIPDLANSCKIPAETNPGKPSTHDIVTGIKTYYEMRFMAYEITIKYLSFVLDKRDSFIETLEEIPKDLYHNSGVSVKLYENDQEIQRGLGL